MTDPQYMLTDLPMNLMAEGDVFMGASGDWFLVTEIVRNTEEVTIVWKGGTHTQQVPPTTRFEVLLPAGYNIAAREFGATY